MTGLESANLKLTHADKHISAIREIIFAFLADEPSVVTREPEGYDKFHFIKSPPDDISILAGETIYQIRSALDHLVFDLVKLNASGIQLSATWEKRCEFPLLTGVPTKGNPPVPYSLPLPYNFFEKSLPGISKEAFAFIESVQPYNRVEIGTWLGRLAALSNIDKHRYLTVIRGQAQRRDDATVMYKGMKMVSSSVVRVEDGASTESPFIAAPDIQILDVHVCGAFQPFVSFSDKTLDPGVKAFPVQDLLQECLGQVQRTIVPAFEMFINQP